MKNAIFNLPDNEYQYWKEFTLDNVTYDFDHLKAVKHEFKRTIPKKGRAKAKSERYLWYFTFSHHCFTRSLKENEVVDPKRIYPRPDTDLRVFDPVRYKLSLFLPQIVARLDREFMYHGGHGRYCSCKLQDDKGNYIFYQVVYRAWKKNGKMRFHIESAYPLPEKPGKVKKVNFWSISHCIAMGKTPPLPADD